MTGDAFTELVDNHRAGWLRDAAALCRKLDWHSVTDGTTIHLLDADVLPPLAKANALAWTAAGADRVLRPHLFDRRGGPVLVLDVGGIVHERLKPAEMNELEAVVHGRLEVAVVAVHELAHAQVAVGEGRSIPADTTMSLLVAAAGSPTSEQHWRRSHGPAWVRSYVHLADRAARSSWPHEWWLSACQYDLRCHEYGNADQLVESLACELGSDDALADILRRAPPTAFLDCFDPTFTKEVNHGSNP